jgi:cbb3-type cytochrome oxidase subunit 3
MVQLLLFLLTLFIISCTISAFHNKYTRYSISDKISFNRKFNTKTSLNGLNLLSNNNNKIKPIMRYFKSIFYGSVFSLFMPLKKAIADTTSTISGWDLYGRVPYDDFLFSSWRLTDPNILKRSFAEAVNENSIFN